MILPHADIYEVRYTGPLKFPPFHHGCKYTRGSDAGALEYVAGVTIGR